MKEERLCQFLVFFRRPQEGNHCGNGHKVGEIVKKMPREREVWRWNGMKEGVCTRRGQEDLRPQEPHTLASEGLGIRLSRIPPFHLRLTCNGQNKMPKVFQLSV